jgi:ATP-dependent RNA helicase DHX36
VLDVKLITCSRMCILWSSISFLDIIALTFVAIPFPLSLLTCGVFLYQVLVISGETGCGKTTQLPQFILEEEIDNLRGADCSIICTQPRRISAISVAARVASERGEELGETVGYQIRLESKRSAQTRLLFCTTGVLLRRLVQEPDLVGVSHLLVDEIHERGMNEDFLIIILRDLLPRRPDLRLVLMSATINAELFSKYFGDAPIMHIPGFTFPVTEFFLEDVLEKTRYKIKSERDSSAGSSRKKRLSSVKSDPLSDLFEVNFIFFLVTSNLFPLNLV